LYLHIFRNIIIVGVAVSASCRLFHVPCGTKPFCAWYVLAARVDGRPHDATREKQLEALQCNSRGDAMAWFLQAMHKEVLAADKAR
jgi:hypothetical protein